MQRKVSFAENEFYHVYNRGVEKREVFLDRADYDRYIKLLYICNSSDKVEFRAVRDTPLEKIDRGEPLVAIGAYCLMPNHFHLLLTPLVEGGISRFMLKVQTAYSMYFNKKTERVGGLFQNRFKAEHADTDRYLRYLYSYIHLNPAVLKDPLWRKKGKSNLISLKKFIETYPYSSYYEYKDESPIITDPKAFPEYFISKSSFSDAVDFWLTYNEK